MGVILVVQLPGLKKADSKARASMDVRAARMRAGLQNRDLIAASTRDIPPATLPALRWRLPGGRKQGEPVDNPVVCFGPKKFLIFGLFKAS
jgi:hypothetical protein